MSYTEFIYSAVKSTTTLNKVVVIVLTFIFITNEGYSQGYIKPGARPFLSFRQSVNIEDYLMGFDFGMISESRKFNSHLLFDFRPGRKKVQEHAGGNLFYQYAEKRYFIGLGVGYMHSLNNSNRGFFTNLNGNHVWGDYAGTNKRPQKGYNLVPQLGVFWLLCKNTMYLRLGYEYNDTKSEILPHRLIFSITGVIN